MEEVVDLVVSGEETLSCHADLKHFICRSRRRGFSARLFKPLCFRCSIKGITSPLAAPKLASLSVIRTPFSTYNDTPRATARPHWQCREPYTDRLLSPKTGGIGRALQGYAVTCCRHTSAMTRAAARLNTPMIRRLIPGSLNYRWTPSKTPVKGTASCCARKQEAVVKTEPQSAS